MANKLSAGSSNRFLAFGLHRASGADVGDVSVASAFIFVTSDGSETPLANSSISLELVDEDADDPEYQGVFPSSVPLDKGVRYTVRGRIVLADSTTREIDTEIVATRN